METSFHIRPLESALGAEVLGVDLSNLADRDFSSLHKAWLEHMLLVFHDQRLDPAALVGFARRFGRPVSSKRYHNWSAGHDTAHELLALPPEISLISNIKKDGQALGLLGDGEVAWHSDFSFKECPTAARMLYALEVPAQEEGGSTFFLNTNAAWDELPAELKQRVVGKTIKQDNTYDTAMKLREGAEPMDDVRLSPGVSHPIISTHPETGRNALFLGRRHGAYINGMDLQASENLLNALWAHADQVRFIHEHRWKVGDVVIWDNRCLLHKRSAFNPQRRRLLHAVQVEGHRPYEAVDALTLPAHPRRRPAPATSTTVSEGA